MRSLSTTGMDSHKNADTMPTEITLDTICGHCGRPLRDHCTSRDDLLWYRPCGPKLRATYPDQWTSETGPDHAEHCLLCGWTVQAHYDWQPFGVTVFGKLIMPRDPCAAEVVSAYLGCGPTED